MFDIKDTDIHEVYALSYEPTVSYNKSFLRKITKFFWASHKVGVILSQ